MEEERRKLGSNFHRHVKKSDEKMTKAKILVVEDEAITAKDIQDGLRGLGYDAPAIASSGEGAIKKAEAIKPDLVLMDIVLTGDMDGIEAAEQIHNRFDIPVVYLTAYIDEERLEKTKVTEPYGYIIKPFEDKELRPIIEMALQRHKLVKVLRESVVQYRGIFNSATDSFLIFDLDGNIVEANPHACRMYGYSREELIGNEIAFSYPDDQLPKLEKALKATMDGGWIGELVAMRKNGELFPIAVSSSIIKDDEGNVIAYMASHDDISERKRAKEELKKKNEELEIFNRLVVGRELKMIELKKEINSLLVQLGEEPRYKIAGES